MLQVKVELSSKALLSGILYEDSIDMPAQKSRPTVLVFPGGAYLRCSDREAWPVAMAYSHYGYQSFVLRYTVGSTSHDCPKADYQDVYSSATKDALEALDYIIKNSEELNVDPKRIVVVGFSAGAHLALTLGIKAILKPSALVLGYGVYEKIEGEDLPVSFDNLLPLIKSDLPPVFMFSTRFDTVVPIINTIHLQEALANNNIPFEAHIYGSGDHGLSLALDMTGMEEKSAESWHRHSIDYLEAIFAKDNLIWGSAQKHPISIDSRIDLLISKPKAKEVLDRYLPGFSKSMINHPVSSRTLRRFAKYSNGKLTNELLEIIDQALKEAYKD